MNRQEQEIREALAITEQHIYTIVRPPHDRQDLFGQKICSFKRRGNTALITTEYGETLTITFDIFRFQGTDGVITLFRGSNKADGECLIELDGNPHTTASTRLLAEAGRRLRWNLPSA